MRGCFPEETKFDFFYISQNYLICFLFLSYKTELCIMRSQTELLTLKFNFYFKLVTQCEKNFNMILELATQDFLKK